MRVLLTGSTGLIGAAVADRLRSHYALHTVGRQAGLVDEVVDLSDPVCIDNLHLPDIDALVHCAGVIDEDFKTDPLSAYGRATLGAEALLKAAMKSGCGKFIYVSSTHVYGAQAGSIAETCVADPRSHYALAHYCTEQLFRQCGTKSNGSYAVLRPNAVYGLPAHPKRFQRWSLIPFSFPREAKADGRITLKSSGMQKRNFVSTSAIADMVARCLDGDLEPESGVVNVLGADTESVYEFAQRCRRIAEEQTGIACKIERPPSCLEQPDAGAGSDFSLLSRFDQPRPAAELNDFIRRYLTLC